MVIISNFIRFHVNFSSLLGKFCIFNTWIIGTSVIHVYIIVATLKLNYLFISDSYCQCAIRKFYKAIFSVNFSPFIQGLRRQSLKDALETSMVPLVAIRIQNQHFISKVTNNHHDFWINPDVILRYSETYQQILDDIIRLSATDVNGPFSKAIVNNW